MYIVSRECFHCRLTTYISVKFKSRKLNMKNSSSQTSIDVLKVKAFINFAVLITIMLVATWAIKSNLLFEAQAEDVCGCIFQVAVQFCRVNFGSRVLLSVNVVFVQMAQPVKVQIQHFCKNWGLMFLSSSSPLLGSVCLWRTVFTLKSFYFSSYILCCLSHTLDLFKSFNHLLWMKVT